MATDIGQENAAELKALMAADWTIGPCESSPNPRDLLSAEELADHQARLQAISRAVIRSPGCFR